MKQRRGIPAALALLVGLHAGGCVRQIIVDSAADALAGGTQGGVFASDDDPELIAEALPFGLKTMEALLQETPDHRGLLVALAAGFTQYAQGFVVPRGRDANLRDSERIRKRARRLHLRGHRYGVRALELAVPGVGERLKEDPKAAAAVLAAEEIDAIYWTGAPLAAAISLSADDMELVAQLPVMEALMNRALELDPDWSDGAVHEFFISYEGRSAAMGGSATRAQEHFTRAVELTGGQKASPYVALAEAVAVKAQDREMFDKLIKRALAIDPDAVPKYRLINIISQDQARWMRDHVEDLIL